MGWFWGSANDGTSAKGDDAYNKLDPALREFLDRESPVKYQSVTSASTSQPPQEQKSYRAQVGIADSSNLSKQPPSSSSPASASASDTTCSPSTEPATAPPESLFPDGRYAHLWKNYTPQSQIESYGRTDQDRLSDVISAYNERKAQIGRAAVENCVFEQLAERDCFAQGGLHAKLTMCREENKAFNRCYTMQSRFLKALGYLSMQRTPEEEERIQMHADKLYQEMLAREKSMQEAKDKGVPEPVFSPLLNKSSAAEALGVKAVQTPAQSQSAADADAAPAPAKEAQPSAPREGLDIYSADKRKEIEKKLAGKTPAERELEIQLLVAESNATNEYADMIRDFYSEEKKLRADRKERGRETFGDSIKRMWGWDR